MNQDLKVHEIVDYIQNDMYRKLPPITSESNLLNGGIIDSMQIMKLLSFLEKQYSVSIDLLDVNAGNFSTARTIASFVKGLQNN